MTDYRVSQFQMTAIKELVLDRIRQVDDALYPFEGRTLTALEEYAVRALKIQAIEWCGFLTDLENCEILEKVKIPS